MELVPGLINEIQNTALFQENWNRHNRIFNKF